MNLLKITLITITFGIASIQAAEAPIATGESPTLLVVVGAPGLAEYAPQFEESAQQWREVARESGARLSVIGLTPDPALTDREQLQQALEAEPKESLTELWILLIGHGTYDGKEAKFNLNGPDITAEECAEWLAPFKRTVVVVNCASSSAPFINKLTGPNRVIVTATKNGAEQNLTRFAKFFSEAIRDETTDLDKDGQVSLLEAYLTASARVQEFYSSAGRLASEHALLEDNGDSKGTPADWFRGVRAIKKAQDNSTPDGFRAHQLHLIPSAMERRLTPAERAHRDDLERQVAKLRDSRDRQPEADYFRELEAILVQIASLYEESEKRPLP